MFRTVPPTTVTEAPAMQIGTATYEGRHRADDPYRVLNHRPVAAPHADHQPRHAAPAAAPDTRAMPNGTERPGEHWNARLIREAAERETTSTVDRKAGAR